MIGDHQIDAYAKIVVSSVLNREPAESYIEEAIERLSDDEHYAVMIAAQLIMLKRHMADTDGLRQRQRPIVTAA